MAALNGFSERFVSELAQRGPVDALLGLGGVSAIGWFALYAVGAIAAEGGSSERRRKMDRLFAGGTLALCLVPLSVVSAAALVPLGAYAVLSSESGSRTRRVGVILLALTGPLFWGRILLGWFAPFFLGVDAHLAAFLANSSASGNTVQFIGTDNFLYVAPGCSSLHNLSLAVLLWATLLQLLHLRVSFRLAVVGVFGALTMILINVIRIAAITRFPGSYVYLHSGPGKEMFAWASLIAAATVIGGGILVSARGRD